MGSFPDDIEGDDRNLLNLAMRGVRFHPAERPGREIRGERESLSQHYFLRQRGVEWVRRKVYQVAAGEDCIRDLQMKWFPSVGELGSARVPSGAG